MILYFAHHPTFVIGKPIRWAFKICVRAFRPGYIIWFAPYQGNSATIPKQYKILGLGASVILTLAIRLTEIWPQ